MAQKRLRNGEPKSERKALAAALNTLLASPTFASWREGTTFDIKEWLSRKNGCTPGAIVSVAHLDDEEQALVLGVLLEEVLSWVRSLPGSSQLKALTVFDASIGTCGIESCSRRSRRTKGS